MFKRLIAEINQFILVASTKSETFQSLEEAKQYANEYLELEHDHWLETFGNIIEVDKNNLQIRFHYYIGNGLNILQDFNITYLSHIEIKDNFEVIVHRKDLSSSEIKEIKAKTEEYVNNGVKEEIVGDRHYFDKDCFVEVHKSGTKAWYKKEKLHRLDGPAVEYSDGDKEWFIEGIYCTEEEFNHKIRKSLLARVGSGKGTEKDFEELWSMIKDVSIEKDLREIYKQLYIERNRNIPEKIQEILAKDEDEYVRMYLATNPNLTEKIQEILAKDEDEYVRMYLATNPNLTDRVKQLLNQ